jgi:tetratricopeptide (TPR) repeat protein
VPWDTVHQRVPEADVGGLRGPSSGFVVVPVRFVEKAPAMAALSRALLGCLEISLADEKVVDQRLRGGGDREGLEFGYSRNVDGTDFVYRIAIWKTPHFGYLVAAWGAVPDARPDLLDDLVARFTLSPSAAPPSEIATLCAREKKAHALIWNDIGIDYHQAQQYALSVPYFRSAFEFSPDDPVILENLLSSLTRSGGYQEALTHFAGHAGRFSDRLLLQSFGPFLLAQMGRVEEAASAYAALFARGYQNEFDLKDYVELLWEMGRSQEALLAVSEYRRDRDSLGAARLAAVLYRRLGQHDLAIALLAKKRQAAPAEPGLAQDLLDTLHEAGREGEAVDLALDLVAKGHGSSDVHFRKGRSELALGRFAAAQSSFQRTLDQNEAHAEARQYLAYVSGLLGRGDVEAVRRAIPPVEIPDSLGTLPRSDPAAGQCRDSGACYLSRVTAISYLKGVEYRTTEYAWIRLSDQKSVSILSSLQYSFDPLNERIYVNTLRVFGPDGKLQGTGEVATYFVTDESPEEEASQDKRLTLPVPGLAVGSTVELVVTRLRTHPPGSMPFLRHRFSASHPVLRSALYITGDVEAVAHRSINAPPAVADGESLLWTVAGPPLHQAESLSDADESYLPFVFAGDRAAGWEAVAREYLESIRDRLAPHPEVTHLARELTAGLEGVEEKVEALARYVQRNYTYKAIEFGRRAWLPSESREILRNRYGDCKDHAVLYLQLLESIGVPARLALVNSAAELEPQTPSIEQFDHMIVHTEAYRGGQFFDLTDKDHDVRVSPPAGLGGRLALLLDPHRSRLVMIADYGAESSLVTSTRRMRVREGERLEVEETLTIEGYYGAYLRSALRSVDRGARLPRLQQEMSGGNGLVVMRALEVENLDEPQSPLVLRMEYRVDGVLHAVAGRVVGKVPAPWERRLLAVAHQQQRLTPYRIQYPLTVRSEVSLSAPEGQHILLPRAAPERSDDGFTRWSLEVEENEAGPRLRYTNHRPRQRGSSSDYSALEASLSRSLDILEQGFVVVTGGGRRAETSFADQQTLGCLVARWDRGTSAESSQPKGDGWMRNLFEDVPFAFRMLRRGPGFACLAVPDSPSPRRASGFTRPIPQRLPGRRWQALLPAAPGRALRPARGPVRHARPARAPGSRWVELDGHRSGRLSIFFRRGGFRLLQLRRPRVFSHPRD